MVHLTIKAGTLYMEMATEKSIGKFVHMYIVLVFGIKALIPFTPCSFSPVGLVVRKFIDFTVRR